LTTLAHPLDHPHLAPHHHPVPIIHTSRPLHLISMFFPVLLLLGGCSPAARISEPDRLGVGDHPRTARLLGLSVQGRPIEVQTIGSGPRHIVLIGLIHGNEPEGYEQFDQLLSTLRTQILASGVTLHAIPNMNPDGYLASTRGNARSVDLNRNWPTAHFHASPRHGTAPLSEPETQAVHAYLQSVQPQLLVVLHSVGDGPFVDADGPGQTQATQFVDAAQRIDPTWIVRSDYTNPPGSLGTWAGYEQTIPTLTVEFRRGQDPTLARRSTEAGLMAILRALR
jgi:murein peptide amidase A